jgi:ABC-type branched-subunit amino acid transport system substrate-binding protein
MFKSLLCVFLCFSLTFGVVKVGITCDYTGVYLSQSIQICNGVAFWVNHVNSVGGILVNDTFHEVELVTLDAGAATVSELIQNTHTAYRALIDVHGCDALIGPFSSTLTIAAREEASLSNKLLFTTAAAAASVYNGYRYVVCLLISIHIRATDMSLVF